MNLSNLIPSHLSSKLIHAAGSISRGLELSAEIAAYMTRAAVSGARISNDDQRLHFYTENVSRSCRKMMPILKFEIDPIGIERLDLEKRNYLFVSNHMSYVDIMVASSVRPFVFVTSRDMGEVFLLGKLAEMGGSVFVERRHRGQIEQDLNEITKTLRSGFNVMIYPEGTSTNGMQILPFKKTLLMAAVHAERDVVPVALKYMTLDGEAFNLANADRICWYGDMGFPESFAELVQFQSVQVKLEFLNPIPVSQWAREHFAQGENRDDGALRTRIAEAAWNQVQEAYFEGRPRDFKGHRREQMILKKES